MASAHGSVIVPPAPRGVPYGRTFMFPGDGGWKCTPAGAMTDAASKAWNRSPLAAALGISLVLHAALVAVAAGHATVPWRAVASAPLVARLVVTSTPATVAAPPVLVASKPVPAMAPVMLPRPTPSAETVQAMAPATAPVADAGIPAPLEVEGIPLAALPRLGDDLLARWHEEFPGEVAMPVRLAGALRVPYPEAALSQRIAGDVVVWFVVHPSGEVDDIQFVEGDPVFYEAVTSALRSATYMPAANGGENIAYPFALEFDFALEDAGGNRSESPLAASDPSGQVASGLSTAN